MRRKDTFFGLHFDYHANEFTPDIGRDFDPKVLERIVTEVKPDFIQCDTKGHPGYSSYRTKVGYPAPGLQIDLLKEWRRITKEHGVMLFSHISGLWDMKASKEHPDWACIGGDGKTSDRMSPFGKYVDELLIPQLKELALDYDMDGAWVDGECWAAMADYHPEVMAKYEKDTGNVIKPDSPIEDQRKFWAYNRKQFVNYVQHYISEVKKVKPEFDITSNWMNTVYVPDNFTFTDYISGDLSPTNSVDSTRFDGRVMQSFGRNWDIMSWGISFPIHYAKSAVQLCQEAASIIALGGGFQIYNMQCPQRVVMDEWAIPTWAEVSKFCHDRQEYCHKSEIIPDIGVVFDVKSSYKNLDMLYYRYTHYDQEINGVVNALCDSGRGVSIVHSQRLNELDLNAYKSLVLVDASDMEPGLKDASLKYAKEGGNLILIGRATAKEYSEELGLKVTEITNQPIIMLCGDDYKVEIRKDYCRVDGEKVGNVYGHECFVSGDINCVNPPPTINESNDKVPVIVSRAYGKGRVIIVPVDIGTVLFNDNTFEMNRFVRDILKELPESRYYVNKPGDVDILVTKKEDKEYIHLINLLGEHRSERIKTFDRIPPVYGVTAVYNVDKKPAKLVLVPEKKEIPFTYENGKLTVSLDKVDLYSIIQINY